MGTPDTRVLTKVPEVTFFFWAIKVLAPTAGETAADHLHFTLGLHPVVATFLFAAAALAALAVHVGRHRYLAVAYWSAMVLVGTVGTLVADLLTESAGVPLWIVSMGSAALLLVVVTVSLRPITAPAREGWYWLAVLVAFVLGGAAGDWAVELTGWRPGAAVLLPAALIVVVALARRFGGGAIASFWLVFVLTGTLGAALGDFLARPLAEGGLGLGYEVTSLLFAAAVAGGGVHLATGHSDRTERRFGLEPGA